MKKYLIFLYLFVIVSVFKDWRFNDLTFKQKKQIKMICLQGYYVWKYPNSFVSIPVFNTNEHLVKCKECFK